MLTFLFLSFFLLFPFFSFLLFFFSVCPFLLISLFRFLLLSFSCLSFFFFPSLDLHREHVGLLRIFLADSGPKLNVFINWLEAMVAKNIGQSNKANWVSNSCHGMDKIFTPSCSCFRILVPLLPPFFNNNKIMSK